MTDDPPISVAVAMAGPLREAVFGARDIDAGVPIRTVDPSLDGIPTDVEALVTGWDTSPLTHQVLDRLPRLRLVLHTGGTVRDLLPDGVPTRVQVVSAAAANAQPVAHYTVSMIELARKNALRLARRSHLDRLVPADRVNGVPGCRVGLYGMGHVGRLVASQLQSRGSRVAVHDPFLSIADRDRWGVVGQTLPELFATNDVVSVHAPDNTSTRRTIDHHLLSLLPRDGLFVNTSRGALVDQSGLVRAARERADLQFVLDVLDPEQDAADELRRLPNVFLTPHIAGSFGSELLALGGLIREELRRWLASEPLRHAVDPHNPDLA